MVKVNFLEEAADRLAILDLYARYVHATDDQDYEALDTLFLPETSFDWTSVGHVKVTWQDGARADYIRNGQSFAHDFHHATGFRIVFNDDRSEAWVKSKMLNASAVRNESGGLEVTQVHGGYSDVLTKTADGWKIVSRVWNHAFVTVGHKYAGGSGGLLDSSSN